MNNYQSRKNKLIINVVNSSLIFFISFFLVYLTVEFVVFKISCLFGIDTLLQIHKITYITGPNSVLWTYKSVRSIFISGTIMSVALGLLGLFLYQSVKNKSGLFKSFTYWFYLHSLNILFGSLIYGLLSNQNFGYFANWMFFSNGINLIISIISAIMLCLIGYYSAQPLYRTTFIYEKIITIKEKVLFLVIKIYLPFIIGNLLIVLMYYPNYSYSSLSFILSMVLIILFISIKVFINDEQRVSKGYKIWTFPIIEISIFLLLSLGIFFFLKEGISC